MKLNYQVPLSQGSLSFFLPKGQYGNIMLRISGIAAAGVTITRAQLGNCQLVWNGQQVINVDLELLNQLNNLYGGYSDFTSALAGAFTASIIIPTGTYFDSSNIYEVGANDQVQLKIDFPDLANIANVASGNIAIYTKEKIGAMNYLYNMVPRFIVAGGAGNIADTYAVNNISQVFLKKPLTDGLTSHIQILKDNRTIADCDTVVAQDYSDYIHQVETPNDVIAIEMSESKDVREAIGGQVSYQYQFTGAATLKQYYGYISFTPAKAVESRARSAEKIAMNISNVQSK